MVKARNEAGVKIADKFINLRRKTPTFRAEI